MAVAIRFVVQAFEHVDGRLVAKQPSEAPDERSALRQAEAVAARLSGAAAIKLLSDSGRETVTILGAFGDVPDDFADGLAGG